MPTKVLHPTDGVETTSMRFVLNAHYHEDGEYNDFTLEHFYQVLE